MAETISGLKASLMREYYKYFSKYAKGKKNPGLTAWVTSFAPIEILEAFGVSYCYPESYAAVIAASGKEQDMLSVSQGEGISADCCSYLNCFNGCVSSGEGPRGTPPLPDILIATNNQCNTLPVWWNMLADKFNVPLVVLDYPGEYANAEVASQYVKAQHLSLIKTVESLTGETLNPNALHDAITNSMQSVAEWKSVIDNLSVKDIRPTMLFDDINFLITARCKPQTAKLYSLLSKELSEKPDADLEKLRVFWLGYPLWYHEDRYFSEFLSDCHICGSNYITWWNLDYSGSDDYEKLFNAYNYTFLNLSQKSRDALLNAQIEKSRADCAVSLRNKSCKCDFVSARNIALPKTELDIDMIDREYADTKRAGELIRLLKEGK